MADATAVSGYIQSVCPAGDCNVLPVTIPLNALTCDANGEHVPANPLAEWPIPTVRRPDWCLHTIPLCKNNPGNVGWLDWTPTMGGTFRSGHGHRPDARTRR